MNKKFIKLVLLVLFYFSLFLDNIQSQTIKGNVSYNGEYSSGTFHIWVSNEPFGAQISYNLIFSTDVYGNNVNFNYEIEVPTGSFYIMAFRDVNPHFYTFSIDKIVTLNDPKGIYGNLLSISSPTVLDNINFSIYDVKVSSIYGFINYGGNKRKNIAIGLFMDSSFSSMPLYFTFITTPTNFPVPYEIGNIEVGNTYYMVATMINDLSAGTIEQDDPYYIHGDTSSWPHFNLTPIFFASTQPIRLDFSLIDGNNPFYTPPPSPFYFNINVELEKEYQPYPIQRMIIRVNVSDTYNNANNIEIKGYGFGDSQNFVNLNQNQYNKSWSTSVVFVDDIPLLPLTYEIRITTSTNSYIYKNITISKKPQTISLIDPEPFKRIPGNLNRLKFSDIKESTNLSISIYEFNIIQNSFNIIWSTNTTQSAMYNNSLSYDGPPFTDGNYYFIYLNGWMHELVDNDLNFIYAYREQFIISKSTRPNSLVITFPGENFHPFVGEVGNISDLFKNTPFNIKIFAVDAMKILYDELNQEAIVAVYDQNYYNVFSTTISIINGISEKTLSLNTTGNYTLICILNYGNDTLSVSKSFEIILDTQPPFNFNLLSPTNFSWLNNIDINFDWEDSQDNSGYLYYLLNINGTNLPYNITSSSFSYSLQEGTFSWRVVALDFSGNLTYSMNQFIIYVDTTSPSSFYLYVTSNVTNNNNISISWQPALDNFGINKYRILLNNNILFDNLSSTTTSINFYLQEGSYTVYVEAYDFANNKNKSNLIDIYVDTTTPYLVYSFPQNNDIVDVYVSSIVLRFNEPILFDDELIKSVTVYPNIEISTYVLKNDEIIFIISSPVQFGTTYHILIQPNKIKDIAGNYVDENIIKFITRLRPKYKINGVIKDENSNGIKDVKVILFENSNILSIVYTDNLGKFVFDNIDAYKFYSLSFVKQNYEFNPSSYVFQLNEEVLNIEILGKYIYLSSPDNIDYNIGGENIKLNLPNQGDIKIIVNSENGYVDLNRNNKFYVVIRPNESVFNYLNKDYKLKIFALNGVVVKEYSIKPTTADDLVFEIVLDEDFFAGIYIIYVEGPGIKKYKKIAILR